MTTAGALVLMGFITILLALIIVIPGMNGAFKFGSRLDEQMYHATGSLLIFSVAFFAASLVSLIVNGA